MSFAAKRMMSASPMFAEAAANNYFDDLVFEQAAMSNTGDLFSQAPMPAHAKPQKQQQQQQQQQQEQQIQPSSQLSEAPEVNFAEQAESVLASILESTSSDTVKMKASRVLRSFVSAARAAAAQPPQGHFVSALAITGEARADAAFLRCRFELTLLRTAWAAVRLLPGSVALVADARVQFRPAASRAAEGVPFADFEAGTVGVVQENHCLVAQAAGDYVVELDCLAPFATARKTGFQLIVPRATSTSVKFTIPEPDILIKVDPSLFTEFVSDTVPGTSCVLAHLPPVPLLQVNWTENKTGTAAAAATGKQAKKSSEKLRATAEHCIRLAIGEGVVAIEDTISYEIHAGELSLAEIHLDGGVKVVSVDCNSSGKDVPQIKRWECPRDSSGSGSLLRVWLEFGTDKLYELKISAELSSSASGKVVVPHIRATHTEGVVREKGFLAVETDANIEVEEASAKRNMPLVDRSELPFELRPAGANILFAYKFIVPEYKLQFNVKKHGDLGVLIAAVDAALFQATVSPHGGVVYRATFRVRNTQKQYLRVRLPFDMKEVTLWSTILVDQPVKPATQEGGFILLPLKKSSAASSDNEKFLVEITFLHHSTTNSLATRGKGSLTLKFPKIDLPINKVFVEVNVPKDFKWDDQNFEGLKRKYGFSVQPPRRFGDSGVSASYGGGMPQVQLQSNALFHDIAEEEDCTSVLDDAEPAPAMGGKGLLPVDVEFPTTGTTFRFEEFLVLDTRDLELTMDYEAVAARKGRTLDKKKFLCC